MSRKRQILLRKMTFFCGTFSQHSYYRLFLKKKYGPFLWMGFICLNVAEPLLGDSLFFTTKSPEIPGTNLIDFRIMKG